MASPLPLLLPPLLQKENDDAAEGREGGLVAGRAACEAEAVMLLETAGFLEGGGGMDVGRDGGGGVELSEVDVLGLLREGADAEVCVCLLCELRGQMTAVAALFDHTSIRATNHLIWTTLFS